MVSISVFVCFGSKLLLSVVLSFAASPGGRAIYTLSVYFFKASLSYDMNSLETNK